MEALSRYFIELAYNGHAFHGWQVQPNSNSVQGLLNANLSKVLRAELNVIGAGRTDTGVHASFFVAHVDLEQPLASCADMVHKLNRMLPASVVVFRIFPVQPTWHARFDAISREYKYCISRSKNPFAEQLRYFFGLPLDVRAMNAAAAVLLEYNDFTSFSKLHTQVKTNLCTIHYAQWQEQGNELVFSIRADRFLRNMVRSIVGTLMDVGLGRLSLTEFRAVIENKNRAAAGMSVPAQGLFLHDIVYPEHYGVHNPHIRVL